MPGQLEAGDGGEVDGLDTPPTGVGDEVLELVPPRQAPVEIVMLDNDMLIASAVIDLIPAGREWARLAADEAAYEPTQRASWSGSVPARAA